jgi:hypothetical protein
MKKIQPLIDRLNEYKENNKLCGYELNTYTDCGVNQIVFLDFRDTKFNPKNPKDFLLVYHNRINSIDIDEEIEMNRQNEAYKRDFTLSQSINDFTDWKNGLHKVFLTEAIKSVKTPQQRQFEQVVDKLRSQLAAMEKTLELMPKKGDTANECQRHNILCTLQQLDHEINGIELEDFTPNEYSGDFKLSYS